MSLKKEEKLQKRRKEEEKEVKKGFVHIEEYISAVPTCSEGESAAGKPFTSFKNLAVSFET